MKEGVWMQQIELSLIFLWNYFLPLVYSLFTSKLLNYLIFEETVAFEIKQLINNLLVNLLVDNIFIDGLGFALNYCAK